ncbi:MAG: XRE family transcriptional regulator [Alloprevotella sp.]
MVHLGKLVQEELRQQERTVVWFSKKLNCDRTNIYDIFRRSDMDTLLLRRISKILHYDFFADLSRDMRNEAYEELQKGKGTSSRGTV